MTVDPQSFFAGALAEAQEQVAERLGEALRQAEEEGYQRAQRTLSGSSVSVTRLLAAQEEAEEAVKAVEDRMSTEGATIVPDPDEEASFEEVERWLNAYGGEAMVDAAAAVNEVRRLRGAIDELADAVRSLDPRKAG